MMKVKEMIKMINRDRRKEIWKYEHEPQSIKTIKKILKYIGISLLVAFCLFSMLDPVNWLYVLLGLILVPLWKD